MKFAAVLLVALAVASTAYGASKQIVIAPPPPPAAQSGVGPGLIFGFVIKGYTNSTFGATQINQLCAALINFTVGYPRTALKCYLGPEGVNPYSGEAVVVTGFLQWQNFPGMTDQDKANAYISRDANEYYLQNNAVGSLNTTFPGIAVDCSCNPFYTPTGFFGPETRSIPGVPYAKCTVQPKSGDADTEDKVGIDNGKVCPTGPQYIIAATPKESVNLAGTGSGIECSPAGFNYVCRLTANSNTLPLRNMVVGQNIYLNIENLVNTDDCTGSEDAANAQILDGYEGPVTAVGDNWIEFRAPLSCSVTVNNVPESPSWSGDADNAEITLLGRWSPLCDTDFAFYKANNPLQEFQVASEPSIGYTCPACSSSSGSNAVLFSYNGPNKGKYCSPFPLANGVPGIPATYSVAAKDGTSCLRILVDTGSLAVNGGKPMLASALPAGVPMAAIFPGISQNIVEFAVPNGPVAIDTQQKVPCSTPPLYKAPTPGAVGGIVDAGTCNTASAFENGGTANAAGVGGNGIPPDADTCAILTTTVNGPLAPGASPPVPSPAVSPAVSPKPIAPSPGAVVPSPAVPEITCTYSGVYRIRPYYAPCATKFIAWASPSNCSNNVVNLRSTSDLGGKLQRTAWALKTTATAKVGKPTPIIAPKNCAAKHLAAPSNPSNGLKLGGTGWNWEVKPAVGTKTCDMVNLISHNRIKTTAFLSVPKINNKKCSGKFAWAAKDGGRQRFRITKV